MNRRAGDRRNEPDRAVGAGERRVRNRRRGDAYSVAETLADARDGSIVKTFFLGRARRSAVFSCGCLAVDPVVPTERLQLLQCPTHAALQAKLRRRQTDRHQAAY